MAPAIRLKSSPASLPDFMFLVDTPEFDDNSRMATWRPDISIEYTAPGASCERFSAIYIAHMDLPTPGLPESIISSPVCNPPVILSEERRVGKECRSRW